MQDLCETRCTGRHDTALQFENEFSSIIEKFELISECNYTKSSISVNAFITTMLSTIFIITLSCPSNILTVTDILRKKKEIREKCGYKFICRYQKNSAKQYS